MLGSRPHQAASRTIPDFWQSSGGRLGSLQSYDTVLLVSGDLIATYGGYSMATEREAMKNFRLTWKQFMTLSARTVMPAIRHFVRTSRSDGGRQAVTVV